MSKTLIYPDVKLLLPHRKTMLLVDQIEDYSTENLVASTKVLETLPFFDGHFPGDPILPGVVLVEMIFQTCGLYSSMSSFFGNEDLGTKGVMLKDHSKDLTIRAIGIDKLSFKSPIYAGDELLIEVNLVRKFREFSKFSGKINKKLSQELIVNGVFTVYVSEKKKT